MEEIVTNIKNSKFFKIIKNIFAVIGLIWVLMCIIHLTTFDIRLGYEDSDITLNVKKFWGLKQETYFVEFNEKDNKWKYWTDLSNKNRWPKINNNSKQLPLPERAGIYDYLPTPEREFRDFE